jgi:hypothetical protein
LRKVVYAWGACSWLVCNDLWSAKILLKELAAIIFVWHANNNPI